MNNAPISTKNRSVLTGTNSNILTARKIFNSIKPSELMMVEALGNVGLLMPATGGVGLFHTAHITQSGRVFVNTEPSKVAQIVGTFERTGFPLDVTCVSVHRDLANEDFAGFEINPYSMSSEAREAMFGTQQDSQGANHELH